MPTSQGLTPLEPASRHLLLPLTPKRISSSSTPPPRVVQPFDASPEQREAARKVSTAMGPDRPLDDGGGDGGGGDVENFEKHGFRR